MPSKLGVYNETLRLLGQRKLASLSDGRDHRFFLDDAYDDATAYCLEQGFWNHAMRSVSIEASVSITPDFGYTYAFERPDDFVRTWIISPNSDLNLWVMPLQDEGSVWFANVNPIYVRYVCNDVLYGMNVGAWPSTFAHYVSCRLALMVCPTFPSYSDEKRDTLLKAEKRARIDARSKDAMAEPPQFPPRGSWVQSRTGHSRAQLADPNRTIP